MSEEAPKVIWFDPRYEEVGISQIDKQDIPYIRADLVDELVEVLEVLLKLHDNKVDISDAWETSMEEARAALAKARREG